MSVPSWCVPSSYLPVSVSDQGISAYSPTFDIRSNHGRARSVSSSRSRVLKSGKLQAPLVLRPPPKPLPSAPPLEDLDDLDVELNELNDSSPTSRPISSISPPFQVMLQTSPVSHFSPVHLSFAHNLSPRPSSAAYYRPSAPQYDISDARQADVHYRDVPHSRPDSRVSDRFSHGHVSFNRYANVDDSPSYSTYVARRQFDHLVSMSQTYAVQVSPEEIHHRVRSQHRPHPRNDQQHLRSLLSQRQAIDAQVTAGKRTKLKKNNISSYKEQRNHKQSDLRYNDDYEQLMKWSDHHNC